MENKKLLRKVIIFGATGKAGRCLIPAGLEAGHQVSAFVRDPAKLEVILDRSMLDKINIFQGDALDRSAVAKAIAGHEAIVNATGNHSNIKLFEKLCSTVVEEAEKISTGHIRLWQYGGLPGLDIPHTDTMGTDLPGMPAIFRSHKVNFHTLKNSSLDWSFICPGPMFFSNVIGQSDDLEISFDKMPYKIGSWTKRLPKIAYPFIMRSRLKELLVSFEDVAHFIMSNLDGDGKYSRKRIGISYKL